MRAQVVGLDLAVDERRDHRLRDLPIGPSREGGDRVRAQHRPGLRQIETAIAGEPGEQHIAKAERRGLAPCRNIVQSSMSSVSGRRVVAANPPYKAGIRRTWSRYAGISRACAAPGEDAEDRDQRRGEPEPGQRIFEMAVREGQARLAALREDHRARSPRHRRRRARRGQALGAADGGGSRVYQCALGRVVGGREGIAVLAPAHQPDDRRHGPPTAPAGRVAGSALSAGTKPRSTMTIDPSSWTSGVITQAPMPPRAPFGLGEIGEDTHLALVAKRPGQRDTAIFDRVAIEARPFRLGWHGHRRLARRARRRRGSGPASRRAAASARRRGRRAARPRRRRTRPARTRERSRLVSGAATGLMAGFAPRPPCWHIAAPPEGP